MAIIDVIKYEGGNDVFVWKHPKEDFNTSAQLVVHESQEAIIFRDGEASDLYKAGKYTIETENIPGMQKLVSLVTGGVSPNHYEVYFINKVCSMNIFWGTTSPMTIQDPTYQVPFRMRAHGQFTIKVEDSRKLLLKLVGTTTSFTQKTLTNYFRGLLMSRIKDYISNLMVQGQRSFLEINSYLTYISENIKPKLAEVFENYGLILEEFFVESINIEEDEVYRRIRESMGKRAERIIEGMDKATERSFDVAEIQARNQGTAGQMTQTFTGIAAGAAIAPAIGTMMGNTMQPMVNAMSRPQATGQPDQFSLGVLHPQAVPSTNKASACPQCGAALVEGSRFCNQCGASVLESKASITCPVCGVTLAAGSKFCHSCGTQVKEN